VHDCGNGSGIKPNRERKRNYVENKDRADYREPDLTGWEMAMDGSLGGNFSRDSTKRNAKHEKDHGVAGFLGGGSCGTACDRLQNSEGEIERERERERERESRVEQCQ